MGADLELSGVVYGVLVNDPALLAGLGQAASEPPYKAPPVAPVMYVKPRNTHADSGTAVTVDEDVPGFEVGATVGLVIGRTASRLRPDEALDHLAGYLLMIDLTVPHTAWYRPSVRFKARDHSCVFGRQLAAADALDPDALTLDVSVEGRMVQQVSTAGRIRPAARLLADVTEFMTLRRGDVLLTSLAADAVVATAGQRIVVSASGLGAVEATLVAAGTGSAVAA